MKTTTPNSEICLQNDLSSPLDADGYVLLAPFGQHSKTRDALVNGKVVTQRFLQILDNASADELLNRKDSSFRNLRGARVGLAVYAGRTTAHPDTKEYAPETIARFGNKQAMGVLDDIRKSARGIEGHITLIPEGAAAVVNDGCKFPSVFWRVMPTGETRDGQMVVHPFQLLSVGLTPFPNMRGVDSLANSTQSSGLPYDDPAAMSKSQAATTFNGLVEQHQRENGSDMVKSWAAVRAGHPALHQAMLISSDDVPRRNAPEPLMDPLPTPIPSPDNLTKLGLARDSSFEEYATAFRANGNKSEPRDSKKVFDALAQRAKAKKGLEQEAADAVTASRHPALASDMGIKIVPVTEQTGHPNPFLVRR
ncbi:hypothetical protein SBV1_3630002 [Verrucomicrobia bacterium]|nr:hypothetical protein SBV1_3630002 [Verrucomicrobiota bacterium]